MNLRIGAAFLLACLSMFATDARAQEAAMVMTANGTVMLQKADGSLRTLAPGSAIQAGDVVTTQPGSSARLRFTDGGELTVSSNSQLRIDDYKYDSGTPKEDSLVMSLLKGGLRSITGLIGRRGNQDAYRLQTVGSTIGIRGTDYIARLCEDDCAKEGEKVPPGARAIAPDIAGRIATLAGEVAAVDKLGGRRPLAVGSAIFTGDIVETRSESYAVLAFVDEGRVTMQPGSRFLIDRLRYEPGRTDVGLFVGRLLKGGVRVLTGAIGKKYPQGFEVQTVVAFIGIRGTGFDAWCSGPCESERGSTGEPLVPDTSTPQPDANSDGLIVTTWEGLVEVRNPAGSQLVGVGQTVRVAARDRAPVSIPEPPPYMRDAPGPRPDGFSLDTRQLFGVGIERHTEQGLYVLVKEGRIAMTQATGTLELSRGESAFSSFDGTQFYRTQFTPTFLARDPVLSIPSAGGTFCGFGY